MNARIIPAAELDDVTRLYLASRMTWAGSDFHKSLVYDEAKGTICLCKDDRGDVLGWARTERWENWPTLEAFTAIEHRGTGVATFCAAGLAAFGEFEESERFCAVFEHTMIRVAKRVGLSPILFSRDGDGWTVDWRRE